MLIFLFKISEHVLNWV